MSNIINRFLYVGAQLIFHSVALDTETWIGFPRRDIYFHMSWLIDFIRATTYEKILIILLIKTEDSIFFDNFYSNNNNWNIYENIFTLISGLYKIIFTDFVVHSYKPWLGIRYSVGK